MLDPQRLERAIELTVNELHNFFIADFFAPMLCRFIADLQLLSRKVIEITLKAKLESSLYDYHKCCREVDIP